MQLALDLKLQSDATFDNFVVGSNGVLVEILKKMALSEGELSCFLWSQSGDGLSHLLQATCHYATQNAIENMYLPLAVLKPFGPASLEGIDALPVVCVDDIDLVAGDSAWEEALFHAFNRFRECGHRLILGAHHPVASCGFQLPDLVSRLAWGVTAGLAPLDDDNKIRLLQLTARRRGFDLPVEVAKYLLVHYSRNMRTQLDLLEKLDALSLQEKHKITLPFVKSKLTVTK